MVHVMSFTSDKIGWSVLTPVDHGNGDLGQISEKARGIGQWRVSRQAERWKSHWGVDQLIERLLAGWGSWLDKVQSRERPMERLQVVDVLSYSPLYQVCRRSFLSLGKERTHSRQVHDSGGGSYFQHLAKLIHKWN